MKKLKFFFFIIAIFQFSFIGYGQKKPVMAKKYEYKSLHKAMRSVVRHKRTAVPEHGGYLTNAQVPNSLKLLPPPPMDSSAGYNLDEFMATEVFNMVDQERKDIAMSDAVTFFPVTLDSFDIVNIEISEGNTPHLYHLMWTSMMDMGFSCEAAKNFYKRARPFMNNFNFTCTPDKEASLRKNGSFPSAHTAVGWGMALILAEIFPAEAEAILIRGRDFGISRNVCNAHWHSDVEAGRMIASAVVGRLHASPTFTADLAKAKKEIANLARHR